LPGLSIDELTQELRLAAEAHAALEENRFDAHGAAVFARGYLRQYGARLGLDVALLVKLYEQTVGASSREVTPGRPIGLPRQRPFAHFVVMIVALGLVGIVLALWWMRQNDVWPLGTATDTVARPAVSSPPAVPAIDVEPETAVRSEPAPAPETVTDREPAAAPAQVAEITPPPAREGAPAPAGEVSAVGAASALATSGPALEVVFVEDSWAEIIDGDGSRLFYDLGRAGTRALLPADRNLNIYLGNASGVELRLDGEPLAIPGVATSDVVRFDLDDVID
jgi:cytoskeleton protein RodZ